MTENKGSSQPKKNGNNGGKSNSKRIEMWRERLLRLLASWLLHFRCSFTRYLIVCLLCLESTCFTEAKLQDPIPAKIYDKNGELVKTLDNGQRHEHVNLKDVPKSMKDAVLATEDNRFYEHGALDYKRLFGAIGKNLTGGFGSEGASTLTQQVVKDAFYHNINLLDVKLKKHTYHIV